MRTIAAYGVHAGAHGPILGYLGAYSAHHTARGIVRRGRGRRWSCGNSIIIVRIVSIRVATISISIRAACPASISACVSSAAASSTTPSTAPASATTGAATIATGAASRLGVFVRVGIDLHGIYGVKAQNYMGMFNTRESDAAEAEVSKVDDGMS